MVRDKCGDLLIGHELSTDTDLHFELTVISFTHKHFQQRRNSMSNVNHSSLFSSVIMNKYHHDDIIGVGIVLNVRLSNAM